MATSYINRDELATLRSEFVGDATVRIRTRMVGGTAVVDLTEMGPHNCPPMSANSLAKIVRVEARENVKRHRAVNLPISDTAIVRERNRLDENGHAVTDHVRVRNLTYVVVPR